MIKLSDCPVPILQCEWEFQQFMEIYKRLDPANIIEIGSFYGGTLWFWLEHGGDNLKRITCVDYPIPPSDGRYNEMIESRKKWSQWDWLNVTLDDLKGDSHSPMIVRAVREIYPKRDVDMLFIDGDHTYRGVKADFENYKDLVRKGGLIVFHDVIGLGDVKKLWDQVKIYYKYTEIFGNEGGWGIGVLEV